MIFILTIEVFYEKIEKIRQGGRNGKIKRF